MKKFLTLIGAISIILTVQLCFGADGSAFQESTSGAIEGLKTFYNFTGFANFDPLNLVMIFVGLFFLFLGIKYDFEPLLLVPIGTGMIIGNIPFLEGNKIGIYEDGSVLNYLYFGVKNGIYPPLIFLGIGAMTDFSSLISNPKLMLLGAAAQIGVFGTFLGAAALGFTPQESGAIAIIGGADGPTAIFLSAMLAPHMMGAIAIAAYSYMALVPVIQPPLMRLLIPKHERTIKMKAPRAISKTEKVLFPIIGLIFTTFIAPSAIPLLGMLFFGNLLKESGVTERLADTARNSLINIVTILLGVTVGASTQAQYFLTTNSLKIFVLGAVSFVIATSGGLLFARFMNLFLKKDDKINPLIGAAGVSAVPDSARVVQNEGLKSDPNNHLLMHAMAPNVAGVIGSAVAAGILLAFLK
ncbi:sodium ion-translocating decarboxylase subunit beta [Halosquirtibacter laminarini]|uniref:Sodium ion-translocating decarboxylase subunit beta n=1 Tax=Halosquirtibacter laminarini TaxID=3374600 RepID=A0AC61NQ01_9BACT|nr:sodium ion-translocating decarboxylase subunit beta [Prolixibacteraceae bacterium]